MGVIDSGKLPIQTLMFDREELVLDSKQVEHGGVHIVHMHTVLDRMVPQFIGLSISDSAFYSATGHPHGEPFDVMVPTDVTFALIHGGSAKLSTPDDEGVIEHSPLF